MTDILADTVSQAPPALTSGIHMTDEANKRLKARYAAERRFKLVGLAAILFSLAALVILLFTIASNGFTAFRQTHVRLDINLSAEQIAPVGTTDMRKIMQGNYGALILDALQKKFPRCRAAASAVVCRHWSVPAPNPRSAVWLRPILR